MKFVKGHVVNEVYETYWYHNLDELGEHQKLREKDGWKYVGGTSGKDDKFGFGFYVEATWSKKIGDNSVWESCEPL